MVLLVDDRPENLYSLKQLLEKNGFQADTALSGEEALRKILKNRYFLIILDVQMPEMDGFEVAEIISGYSLVKDTPILFLSANYTGKEFIKKGYECGGVDYVTKPVDPEILLLKVKTFHKLRQQAIKLEETQHELLKEIERREEQENKKNEFLSIASHELKTPLTSINGYLQLIEMENVKTGVPISQHLVRVKKQTDRLTSLVTGLIDISRIETGRFQISKKLFDFNQMVQQCLDAGKISFPEYQVQLKGESTGLFYGDEYRLEQVLLNLLANAAKYSPKNQIIQLELEQKADRLTVSVKDRGIGIREEKIPFLFDKFYHAEETFNQFQGMGIGLYISAQIIRQHGGEYGVYSQYGEGSCFYFELPIDGPE